MTRRTLAGVFVAAIVLGAPAAQAGVLTMATWSQVVSGLPDTRLPPFGIPLNRTTAQLDATGSSTSTSIAVDLFYPQFSTAIFVPKTSMFAVSLHVKLTQGGPLGITATPSMAAVAYGDVDGTVIVMTAIHLPMGVNQSMFNAGINTLVRIPLSHGGARQFTSSFLVLGTYQHLTVDFFDWTPGTQTFTGLTSMGVALPDVVAMGSFMQTTYRGTVTLVSPTRVSINGSIFQSRSISLTTLKLSFVPEPGTLLLLGAAAWVLALRYGKTR